MTRRKEGLGFTYHLDECPERRGSISGCICRDDDHHERSRRRYMIDHRMNFIAGRLASEGFVNRKHLVDAFGFKHEQARKMLQRFIKLRPGVMVYNRNLKRYERV